MLGFFLFEIHSLISPSVPLSLCLCLCVSLDIHTHYIYFFNKKKSVVIIDMNSMRKCKTDSSYYHPRHSDVDPHL